MEPGKMRDLRSTLKCDGLGDLEVPARQWDKMMTDCLSMKLGSLKAPWSTFLSLTPSAPLTKVPVDWIWQEAPSIQVPVLLVVEWRRLEMPPHSVSTCDGIPGPSPCLVPQQPEGSAPLFGISWQYWAFVFTSSWALTGSLRLTGTLNMSQSDIRWESPHRNQTTFQWNTNCKWPEAISFKAFENCHGRWCPYEKSSCHKHYAALEPSKPGRQWKQGDIPFPPQYLVAKHWS